MTQTKILAVILATAGALAATTAMAKPGCGSHGPKMQFEELDTDGNGEISKAEMEAHKAARFSATDTDGDGMISADEMLAKMQERAAKRVEKMINRMDKDGDGMLSAEEMANRGRHGDMFGRMDSDGNGAISKEEFDQARENRGGKRRGGQGRDCGGATQTEQN
ncbi:EF-hand domain-containing protein [Pseudophaeobacter sp.]|uniref:EF-hand domain-containing protein n=1 Tax=Pseudophaeobacter sp. TaxID=1971739 RepID=UPI003297D5FE